MTSAGSITLLGKYTQRADFCQEAVRMHHPALPTCRRQAGTAMQALARLRLPASSCLREGGLRSQPLTLQLGVLCFIDPVKLDVVAGAQGEVAVGDFDEFEGRLADDVPAAGTGLGVDAGLPAGQADAAG